MLHGNSFQIINMYSISCQNRVQSYCDTTYSKGGVNQMWILKNSNDLLEYIQFRSLSSCNSINIFDFSTLYTTIPHSKLKDKLRELFQPCFIKTNDQRRYKYLVLGRDIFVMFGGRVFQQTVSIPMGTKCVPLLADYSFIRVRGFS